MNYLRAYIRPSNSPAIPNSAAQNASTASAGLLLFSVEFLAAEVAWALVGASAGGIGVTFGAIYALFQSLPYLLPDGSQSRPPMRDGALGRWILLLFVGGPFCLSAAAILSASAALICRPFIGAGFLASAVVLAANAASLLAAAFATAFALSP
jgi:hypothetical protein